MPPAVHGHGTKMRGEHQDELEDAAQLAMADHWQRTQAWATWKKIEAGDEREVSWDELKGRACQP